MDISRQTWTWWGKHAALAIPAWDGPAISGFFLLTTKGTRYLQLTNSPSAVGFGLVAPVGADWQVVVDQIEAAVSLVLWGRTETGRILPFVCPTGLADKPDNLRARRLVYWTPTGALRHYLRAVQMSGAQVLPHNEVQIHGGLPCDARFDRFIQYVRSAIPAHEAAARQLLDTPIDDARAVLAVQQLDPADKSRMLAYVQGEDARALHTLLSDTAVDRSISWSGQVITDTPSGWICRGQVISAVKLYIEQIRPYGDEGEALATGTLVFVDRLGARQVLSFAEQLSNLRKNVGDWLQRKVIATAGQLPFIDARWKNKLLEIAQQFHEPVAVMANKQYGWDGKQLRMPYFVVGDQLHAATLVVDGPLLPLPSALTVVENDAFKSDAFCRLYLALVGNLMRTQMGRAGLGLLLTNEQHVVARLANAMGAEVLACPSGDLLDVHALDPLPLFTEWTPTRLRELFSRSGPKNVVVSVDKYTARLASVRPDWLHVRVGDVLDYQALRSIFLVLPRLVRADLPKPEAEDFYRRLAVLLADQLRADCPTNRLTQVAFELDQYYVCRNNSAGTRLVELMIHCVMEDQIKVVELPEYVELRFSAFRQATASPIVIMPTITEITDALRESRCLINVTDRAWHISRSSWDIMRSLAGVR